MSASIFLPSLKKNPKIYNIKIIRANEFHKLKPYIINYIYRQAIYKFYARCGAKTRNIK
jgi:hypothetical protein